MKIYTVLTAVILGTSVFLNAQEVPFTAPKEPVYKSKNPLYFCVVLGKEGKNRVLCVIDESKGTGTGYDTTYIDNNRNNDLTDEPVIAFPFKKQYRAPDKQEPEFEFAAPFMGNTGTKYTLSINNMPTNKQAFYYFGWSLHTTNWSCSFINGRMCLYPSAEAAVKGTQVHLGSDCTWKISSYPQKGQAMVSAGLKDKNNCTLRSVRSGNERPVPVLRIIKDGRNLQELKMEFG